MTVPNGPGLPGALFAHVCGPFSSSAMPTSSRRRMPVCPRGSGAQTACAWPATGMTSRAIRRVNRRAASPSKAGVLRSSHSTVGVPYRWVSRETGFDCSGLVRWAAGRVGSTCRTTRTPSQPGRRVRGRAWSPVTSSSSRSRPRRHLPGTRDGARSADRTKRQVVRLETNYGSRLIGARRVAASWLVV